MHSADPSSLGFALETIVKSILLLSVALLLVWSMRRFSAAARHLCLAAAAVSLLALPVASLLLPSWPVLELPAPLVSALEPGSPEPVEARTAAEQQPDTRNGGLAASPGAESSPDSAGGRGGWLFWLLLAWGAGAALLLVRLIGGKIYGHSIVSRAPAVRDPRLLAAGRGAAEQFGIARPIDVLESNHLKVPFVWGLLRPRLVLPPGAAKWPSERLEAVVRHELAHVKRRDLLVQFLAQVACCLYWINPLVWVMERKMFIERERACDDMALGRETKASDYAGHLMEVVEELGAARNQVWVVSAMAEGTDFKDRIVSVLDPAARRSAPRPAHAAAVIAVSFLLVVSLSSLRPLSGATTAPETPAGRADGQSASTGISGESRSAAPIDDTRLDSLVTSLEADDASVRRHAATALGQLRDARALPALIAALRDEDPSVREHAATALGELGDSGAAPALEDALGDANARVREHVATALGQIGDAAGAPPLGQALLTDSDPRVREHVASALGQIGDPAAIPPLTHVLSEDANARVREHAASALGQAGKNDDGAFRALVDAFENDESVRVRAHAAFGLGLIGDRRAFDLLVGGLSSPHPEMRVECAEALGLLGDPRAVPYLEKFVNDPDDDLRRRAQHSLQMLLESR